MQTNNKRQTLAWTTLLVVSSFVILTSGCANVYHLTNYNWLSIQAKDLHHRPYYHSPQTGRIIAKDHHLANISEPACFGYEPTCWHHWPIDCPGCPIADPPVVEEVVAQPAEASVMPPADESAEPIDMDKFKTPAPSGPFRELEEALQNDATDAPVPQPDAASSLLPDDQDVSMPEEKVDVSPVDEQVTDQPLIEEDDVTTTVTSVRMPTLQPRLARREVEQKMVIVDEWYPRDVAVFESVSLAQLARPPVPEAGSSPSETRTDQTVAAPPAHPSKADDEVLRLSAESTAVVSDTGGDFQTLLATLEQATPHERLKDESASVSKSASESLPTFAISAVLPRRPAKLNRSELKLATVRASTIEEPSEARTDRPSDPQDSTSIRFVSEPERKSLRVGNAIQVRDGKATLRFR